MTFKDYQADAIERGHNGCIFCGGTGSGKSITGLGYFFKRCGGKYDHNMPISMERPMDLYIITTAKKRDECEWDGELAHFLLSRDPEKSTFPIKVYVDSWNNIKKYIKVRDAFFIFDEQRVVGYGAWTKAFLKIAKLNEWVMLSATPGDTWLDYAPVFIANGYYSGITDFKEKHVCYKPYMNYPVVSNYMGVRRLNKLRSEILIDMDYSRSSNVIDEDIWCEYDRVLYSKTMKNRWDFKEDKPIDTASGLCYTLREIVNSDPSRATMLDKIYKRHPRLIIFYNFNYERSLILKWANELKIPVGEWNGHAHTDIPDTDSWVYVVQYNAGAEGWNCIKTNCIIFYSQTYSYKTLMQAKGRIDRLNTPYNDLYYYYLRSSSKIDLAISSALKSKKNFNERGFVND